MRALGAQPRPTPYSPNPPSEPSGKEPWPSSLHPQIPSAGWVLGLGGAQLPPAGQRGNQSHDRGSMEVHEMLPPCPSLPLPTSMANPSGLESLNGASLKAARSTGHTEPLWDSPSYVSAGLHRRDPRKRRKIPSMNYENFSPEGPREDKRCPLLPPKEGFPGLPASGSRLES